MTDRLEELRQLWREKERLKCEVLAWMRDEGRKGRLRQNQQAPMWSAYEDAEKKLAEALPRILGA